MIEGECDETVLIEGLPAARVGDFCTCDAIIIEGSENVYIGGPNAARMLDETDHGGMITKGAETVFIGDIPAHVIPCMTRASQLGSPLIGSKLA